MPNKTNPNAVVVEYQTLLDDSLATYGALCAAASASAELQKQLAVDAFLRAAVGLETFRSDWHIAAINRDSSVFRANISRKVDELVTSNWPWLKGQTSVAIPLHPSLERVRTMLDPRGRNVSLGRTSDWRKRASHELAPPLAARVAGITGLDQRLVDLVPLIRNVIAHRSSDAGAAMNQALKSVEADLRRGSNRVSISGIGAYLHALRAGVRRVEIFHLRLKAVVQLLYEPTLPSP